MVEIREVKTKSDLKKFVKYPFKLYKDVPQFMPPLISEDLSDWDPKKNPAFEYSEARCFLAYRDGEIVGRIGAILSHAANQKWGTKRMRFTQVDFINDDEVVDALFATVENWAREKGMTEVHGPLGFTDQDREGMLVEGFDQKSMFITYYNYPYYIDQLTRVGYVKDVDWVEFLIDVPYDEKTVDRLHRLAERVSRMTGLHVADVPRRRYPEYIPKVFELVNLCYAPLYGTVDLSQAQIDKCSKKFAPLVNPKVAAFVENDAGDLVAFGVSAPSIASAIKRHNGHMFPFGFIDILHALHHNDTLDLFLIAVHPDYRNTGVNALMMDKVLRGCHEIGIKKAETGPQLEMNVKIQHQWNLFNYKNHKRRRCFVKQL